MTRSWLRGRVRRLACALLLLMLSLPAAAEEGVTSNAIVLTRIIAMDGPAGAKGREQEAALEAYFATVNASGGIHGRRIQLRTTNADLKTDEALKSVIERDHPFALFLFGGTAGSAVAMKYAVATKTPFIAPNSGANVFHQPPSRYVFNVRARYQDEVVAAIKHFSLVNQRRLALVHVDDAFGRDGAEGYRAGVQAMGVVSVHEGRFANDNPDFAKHVDALVKTSPQAVVCIGASKRVAEFIALARQAGVSSSFMTLSNNSSSGFARELGARARGVIVSQVTPPPATHTTRMSRELSQLLANRQSDVSYAAMEAYASAKVLVEGLRRAGPNLTREGLVQALESMHRVDIGGLEIDYSTTKRSGSSHVELSILTEDGKYRR